MLNHLIHRPIAVSMGLIAVVVMGCVAMRFIPISLMPDIDIPQITVQAACPGYSASEVENRYTSRLRGQLMQVGGTRDIRSESRADAGSVVMTFEPGMDMDLLFIEVNEKIDRAMNNMPREFERPKVIKAGAMDIPAFYLDIWLKDEVAKGNPARFAELGRFAKGVVSKRIEQLPQTAMVDVSGTVGTEIVCTPIPEKTASLGITMQHIESAIKKNNITLESLSVVDGIYRYHIHFDSQLLTKEDIADIYLEQDGRLLQLRDLCLIEERMQEPNGLVRHDGHRAVTMAIIKQNDAQMADLQESMEQLIKNMEREYPDVEFALTRDQTSLLSYTISNLESNLWVGAILACLILLLFMREWRFSMLIIVSIPLALILTLLSFYAIDISMNIISISGLILGVGMIVDNSIIVIDNVSRRWQSGEPLSQAVVEGTREVFTPMLSSVLTTCSVFVPLIFLSGTAGALFYDQAMGVSLSLFASLLVAVMVVPVYFYALYRKRQGLKGFKLKDEESESRFSLMKPYERTMKWVLRHGKVCMTVFLLCIPIAAVFFRMIEKQRMPDLPEKDAMLSIDWNSGISPVENDRRVTSLLDGIKEGLSGYTSMVGTQEFLLSHTRDITSSEAEVYLHTPSADDLSNVEQELSDLLTQHYPNASFEFGDAGNIYNLMFSTDEADLEIHLQDADGRRPDIEASRCFVDTLQARFPEIDIMPVVTEANIRYVVDMEQMAFYKVTYNTLLGRLKELISRGRVYEISDGAQSVPVLLGTSNRETGHILQETVMNEEGTHIPIYLLVRETQGEHYKRLQAAAGGAFYSVDIKASDREVERLMEFTNEYVRRPENNLSASYAGGYFTSRQLIGELALILTVALALLYFILAAQFESLVQPFIILTEIVFDVFFVILALWMMGMSLNLMSMIGLVVMSGIVINDSILKVDTINRLRNEGNTLLHSIMLGGRRRLRPIVMTSLTTILALVPFLGKGDMGSALQYPLSVTLIVGMTVGTLVSLFFVPLLYYIIYRRKA